MEPFVFINTTAVRHGHLEDFKRGFQKVVELAETEEPRLLHFASYTNEEGTEITVVQVHPDADSMALHMELAAKHIQGSHEVLDHASSHIQIYGEPTEAVLEQIRQLAGSGARVTVKTPLAGFNRLPE